MSTLAELPAPVVEAAGTPSPRLVEQPAGIRRATLLAATALLTVVVVNVPPVLRTALDCDPILFDLFVRDAGRGSVLYRDMVENNTPAMIGLHWAIRSAFGWSTEALRVADLVIVGAAVWLLSCWFHRGRYDLRLFNAALLATLYLSTTEWCHAQRDVWALLPVMAALYLRRAQVARLATTRGSLALALAEGMVWALAVWIKPHVAVVAAAAWAVTVTWARANGAGIRALVADAAAVFLGGLVVGAAGIAAMDALGIWRPYVEHLTGWAGEYSKCDMYGPVGPWFFRLGYFLRNSPWSFVYLAAVPAALVLALAPLRAYFSRRPTGDPAVPILAAASVAWAVQAWLLQHVFDYPHIAGAMLAVTLIVGAVAASPPSRTRTAALVALGFMAAVSHAPLLGERVSVWGDCIRDDSPELKDRLARYPRIGWAELELVSDYLKGQNVTDGEVMVISDTALPLWERTGLTPPVRYYIVQNNILAFRSRRTEIIAALAGIPNQRFLVCDIAALRWDLPPGCDWRHPEQWPFPADWYGPRRWADKVVFRAGRYVVLAMPASETPAWLADVSDI